VHDPEGVNGTTSGRHEKRNPRESGGASDLNRRIDGWSTAIISGA
jgi:hypothetical protein